MSWGELQGFGYINLWQALQGVFHVVMRAGSQPGLGIVAPAFVS